MTPAQEELTRLEHLLRMEKQADLESYRQKISQNDTQNKIKEGVSWFPVRLTQNYFTQGEKPVIEVERKTNKGKSHGFQSGKLVSFYSIISPKYHLNGVVNHTRDDVMTITLNTDDLPLWIDEGSLGVDLLFDESTYREMFKALRSVIKADGDSRLADLREILLGKRPAEFGEHPPFYHPVLNESQCQAVSQMKASGDVGIIHGPPGTGKTTTIIQLIREVLKQEKQVLVCAPSNTAVDLLVERLTEEKVSVVRIGHPARVSDDQLIHTLDASVTRHEYFSDLKSTRKKSEEYFTLAAKYKRNYGYSEKQQRKLIYNEARKLRSDAFQLEFYIQNDVINKAQVIACTLTGAANQALAGKQFSTVIIDEAAQALEPACWIPVIRGDRVIFAGDHLQLPPTIKSYQAAQEGLSSTLFEKAIKRNKADAILQTQYRMLPEIMDFPNNHFYKGLLKADTSIRQVYDRLEPVLYVDTAGSGDNELRDQETLSTYNIGEAEFIRKILIRDISSISSDVFLRLGWTIGIITPYRAQMERIKEAIRMDSFFDPVIGRIQVNTIDGFQGQEKELIYISFVRSNDKGEIGFLADSRRVNVAITRAKQRLVVIGDSATLGASAFFDNLIKYYQAKGYYRSIFEFLYE